MLHVTDYQFAGSKHCDSRERTNDVRFLPPPPPQFSRISLRLASCVAVAAVALALGGCGASYAERDAALAERDAARVRAAAAENALAAAENTLEDLRDSLAKTQAALGSTGTDVEQRMATRRIVVEAREDLMKVRETLDGAGNAAVGAALTAVDLALTRTAEALAPATGAGGLASASMHTSLDRAQAALDAAQTALTTALDTDPADALRTVLYQAQGALSTAQVSLVPKLRQELRTAESERDAAQGERDTARSQAQGQRERAEKAEGERDTVRGERDTARSQAQGQRERAEKAEGERDTARAERNAARSDAEEQRKRADTYDPRLVIGERLTPLEEERVALPPSLAPTGTVTWTPRTMSTAATLSSTANPNALAIRDEARAHTDGRRLFPDSGTISQDEFLLRGVTLRGDQLGRQPDRSTDNTINPPVMGSGAGTGTWSNYDATYESSIRMRATGDGMTLRMGGTGTIFYDMERLTALGPGATQNQPGGGTCANTDNAACDDPTTSDIEAAFGTPVADPDGAAAWYFRLPVPVNPATPHTETRTYASLPNWAKYTDDDLGRTLYRVSDAAGPYEDGAGKYRVERAVAGSGDVQAGWQPLEFRRALRIDRGRPADLQGVYNAWLSNYAGGAGTEGDPHRYLKDAAYGLFNFLDYSTTEVRYGRLQAFHFGYDAFRNASGQRPADWGTAANPVTATFEGSTTGWLLQAPHQDAVSRLVRLRGDVTLTANLNADGTNSHGTIQGSMRNFEFLNNGVWGTDTNHRILGNAQGTGYAADDARLGNAVMLEAANVTAEGSFGGVAYAAHNSSRGRGKDNFVNGTWGGTFYGPRELGALEAAGHWRLPVALPAVNPEPAAGTLIGSFGAKSERPAN